MAGHLHPRPSEVAADLRYPGILVALVKPALGRAMAYGLGSSRTEPASASGTQVHEPRADGIDTPGGRGCALPLELSPEP